MKYSRRNSFILLDEEKKAIRKLYEATTASASGSYSQPMSWQEETISPCAASESSDECPQCGELLESCSCAEVGNVVDGSEEMTIDADELMSMIGLSEEDEKERMRQLHRDSSVIKEQSTPTTDQLQEIAECLHTTLGDVIGDDSEIVFPLSCFNCYMFPTTGFFPPQINPECNECLEEASDLGKILYDAATSMDMTTLSKIKGCIPNSLLDS